MEQTDVMARQAADAEEMRWGPWVEWKGGECPIPGVKAGEWQCRCAGESAMVGHQWFGSDEHANYASLWRHLFPRDDFNITAYRVLKTAAKPVEPAALPLPASDLPGIAKQQAWLAAQPAPVPPPAPTPKEHPGLATIAPMSGRVGGRWGV
jgi:hypothetical protein